MDETARHAMKHGLQLSFHAIGDRANRETLDIFERAFKANPGKKDLRWRVEHAQHISAQDIPRVRRPGGLPSLQGIHRTSEAPYGLERLGPRRAAGGPDGWAKVPKAGPVLP